ncbi:hypothetical protein [Mycolicibacterium mageritense]|uniref:hypothetical protein n=1 Tax=Mycolicibacterium mageritense TaxID=53462 RepID=UPI001E40CE73|nr:hypothetical protein [Mycolicibacterium mageritense]GJJ22307.1 hypothetical protein MTY414_59800 [Mycolicibacterium mageritense]
MPWFYVDDAFADSKPVMQLDARIRNEAIGLWVRCGAWSAKEETDGHVPMDVVRGFNGRPAIIRALREDAELWAKIPQDSCRNPREILFNSWEKWQKTRAENQARRKREADKKQTWRAGKKGRDYVPASDDSEMSTGDNMVDMDEGGKVVSTGESTGVSLYPDPTRPDPTPSLLVTSSGGVTSVDANDPRPECPDHQENYDGPCRACGRRRKWDEAHAEAAARDELEHKRTERAAAARVLKACRLCDDGGWLLDTDGTPVEPAVKCPHSQDARHA